MPQIEVVTRSAVDAMPEADAARSLADRAYQQLRDQLIMLEIRPGAPINDGRLALSLGLGRTPVREALKRLESDHLVVSYPRRGTFATGVDITELAEVSEIRELLEPLAARRAARMANAAARMELGELAEKIDSLSSAPAVQHVLMRYDIAVHRKIYVASANRHLEDVLIRYDNLATRIWCLVLDKMPSVSGHIAEHVGLLNAIIQGDSDRAAELALEHVVHFEAAVREVL